MQRLINEIVERAKANRQRIVLPEGTEERTLKAANQILTDGVADLILLGNPAEIEACAKEWGLGNIGKATIIDPANHPKMEEYAQLLCELRKKKGMTIEEARKLVLDPLYLGCLMIKNGDADGQLAGARNTTGDVLRPALQIIKTPRHGRRSRNTRARCRTAGTDCRLHRTHRTRRCRTRSESGHAELLDQRFGQARSSRQGS